MIDRKPDHKYEISIIDLSRPKEPLYAIEIKSLSTGEIRLVRRTSIESAFRTFGRLMDQDAQKGQPF